MKSKTSQYEAVFMPQREGGYTVEVPDLPGCVSEGGTLEEAQINIQEAIGLYIETLHDRNKPIPKPSLGRYFVLGVPVDTETKAYA
jgi:antitoxin HicB